MKTIFLFFLLMITPFMVFSQTELKIKGKVIDKDTDTPILGADIMEKGNHNNGVSSDENGAFLIEVDKNATLIISYLGYSTREIEVNKLKLNQIDNLQVNMDFEASGLDEAIVVGYGKQSKISMVGSVETMKPERLRTPSTNISSNLAGNLSGVIGVQRSGQPGADGASFYIRGLSTYSGAQNPLILLDGVEISAGDLDNLTPETIESVSVLKDATATAVYGNQGANGVLIITTKEGKNLDKPKIYVRAQVSISSPTETPDFVNGAEYMRLYNEAVRNRDSGERLYSEEEIKGTEEHLNPYIFPDVNWYNELFKKAAINEEATVDIRGGGEKVTYYMNARFNHQTGLLKNYNINSYDNNIDIKKYNFQNNLNAQLSPTTKIALKLNTQISYKDGPASDVGTSYHNVMETNPVEFPKVFPSDTVGNPKDVNFGAAETGRGDIPNPFADQTRGYSNQFSSMVLANLSGEQKLDFITKGLKFKAMATFKNYSQTNVTRSREWNGYRVSSYEKLEDGTYDYTISRVGSKKTLELSTDTYHGGDHEFNIQPSLEYNRNFRNHHVGGLILYKLKEKVNNSPYDLISSLPHRRIDFVSRVTYDFDYRYLFEANFAYNGTENFAKHNRFGFFPSLAVGYNISNEKWFNSGIVDLLKLKFSWGRVGNDNIGGDRFPYISVLDLNGVVYTTGVDQNINHWGPKYYQFSNEEISWETADKFNIGIDLDFLQGIHFNASYFYEKRRDIFDDISSTIPNLFGTSGVKIFSNVGQVTNRGVDLSLDFNKKISDEFRIEAKGTFSYAHNTINANNEPPFREHPNLSAIGQSINQPLGYLAERLFIDDAEIEASPKQQLGGARVSPGDVKYRDITGDGKITEDDRVYMGNPTIPEINYGLNTTISYKNWDLSFLIQGAAKTSFFMNDFHPFGTQSYRNVLSWVANERWTENNPNINANYPKLSTKGNNNNNVNSTYWLRNGAFLKLRSAEIGYDINSFTRLFISGYNLFRISNFNKWDPEEGGGSGLRYPTQRILNIGFQINLN